MKPLTIIFSIIGLVALAGCQSSGMIRPSKDLEQTAYTEDPAVLASRYSHDGRIALLLPAANEGEKEKLLRSIISISELSTTPSLEGKRPLKIVKQGAAPFYDVTNRPLNRGCADVNRLRDEWNREMNAGLGPIEATQSYWARPAAERQSYFSVVDGNVIELVRSLSLEGDKFKAQTIQAYLLEERVGQVRQIVRVDKYPPVRGSIEAGMTMLFLPVIATMPEEERREYMMDLGCVSETLIGFDISLDSSSATGKYAIGTSPSMNFVDLEIPNLAKYQIRSESDGSGEVRLAYAELSSLSEHADLSAIKVSLNCIDCSLQGRFNKLQGNIASLMALNNIQHKNGVYYVNLSQAKQIAFNYEKRSMFEPELTDWQLKFLDESGVETTEQIRALQKDIDSQGYAALLGRDAKSFAALRTFLLDMNEAKARNLSATDVLLRRQEREAQALKRQEGIDSLSEWYEIYIVIQETCVSSGALSGSVRRRFDAVSKQMSSEFSDSEKQKAWDSAKANYQKNDLWEMATMVTGFGGLDPNFNLRSYCNDWVSQTLNVLDFFTESAQKPSISPSPP